MHTSLKVLPQYFIWVELWNWVMTESLQHLYSFLYQSFCWVVGVLRITVLLHDLVWSKL